MKKILLLIALIFIIGIVFFIYINNSLKKPIDVESLSALNIIQPYTARTYIEKHLPNKWGRDPFMPLPQKAVVKPRAKGKRVNFLGPATGQLVLNGVFIRGATRIAVINNKPLKIGDIINGHTLIKIQKGFVKFEDGYILKN